MQRNAINIPVLVSVGHSSTFTISPLNFPSVEISYVSQFLHTVTMGLGKLIRNKQDGMCTKEPNTGS